MATEFNVASRIIPSGETVITAPPQVTRCGAITLSIDGDQFPGDPDLQFLTVIVERSTDGFVKDIFEVARFTRSGKVRPQPTEFRVEMRNRDSFEVPFEGRVRVRFVVKSPFRSAVRAKVEDAIDPPPLQPVPNSVAHDGTSNLFSVGNFVASITLSAKTTSGSDRIGIAHVGGQIASDALSITSMTWGGAAMTQIGTGASNATAICDAHLYRYVAPSTTGSDVKVDISGDCRLTLGASSYNGVDQTTPIQSGSPQTGTGASSTPSVNVTSATGNMVVDSVFYDQSPAISAGAGQTQIGSQLTTVGGDFGGGCSYESGASTTTMSWGTAGGWALIAASLAASGGAAPGSILYHKGMTGGFSKQDLTGNIRG